MIHKIEISYCHFIIYLYFFIFYSCKVVIELSGKIPSQALLFCFPECLQSI